ncbi:MAG: hypothetical protein LBD20_08055, partial [Spirochaetaceae bacterium]|nr:hypothetical protein [Spirochaetaceae bacterium]
GVQTDTNGGFAPLPNADSLTEVQKATSWTGKVFTNYVARKGNQEMPKPGHDGGTEYGHEGPGAAKIEFLGESPAPDGRPFTE